MAITRQGLVEALEPAVNALGFELADLEVHVSRARGLLRIFIDSETGVTVDDCEKVSRQVSSLLDVLDPIGGNYTLEVSSPGLDRRLVKPAHFDRFAGAEVQIRLRRMIDGRRRVRGTLVSRVDDRITVRSGSETFVFSLADIERAQLVPDLTTAARAS